MLGSTLPAITDADGLTIDGTGQSVTVSGNNAVRVIGVDYGAWLHLKKLTVANGHDMFGMGGTGGGIDNSGTLTITNSTFSGNRTNEGGGGIHNGGSLTVTNSTFSGNDGHYDGGGIDNSGTLTVANTILANSTRGGDCFNSVTGTVIFSGVNLVQDGSCGLGALTGDPNWSLWPTTAARPRPMLC